MVDLPRIYMRSSQNAQIMRQTKSRWYDAFDAKPRSPNHAQRNAFVDSASINRMRFDHRKEIGPGSVSAKRFAGARKNVG